MMRGKTNVPLWTTDFRGGMHPQAHEAGGTPRWVSDFQDATGMHPFDLGINDPLTAYQRMRSMPQGPLSPDAAAPGAAPVPKPLSPDAAAPGAVLPAPGRPAPPPFGASMPSIGGDVAGTGGSSSYAGNPSITPSGAAPAARAARPAPAASPSFTPGMSPGQADQDLATLTAGTAKPAPLSMLDGPDERGRQGAFAPGPAPAMKPVAEFNENQGVTPKAGGFMDGMGFNNPMVQPFDMKAQLASLMANPSMPGTNIKLPFSPGALPGGPGGMAATLPNGMGGLWSSIKGLFGG